MRVIEVKHLDFVKFKYNWCLLIIYEITEHFYSLYAYLLQNKKNKNVFMNDNLQIYNKQSI